MSRTICVVTGTRAEYGLLYWLIREIQADPELKLQLVVTGMHLSTEFGLTYRAIEADGFSIDERVEMLLASDTAVGVAKSLGLGTIGFADAFARLAPDLVIVLGDRFEILAAAQAAMIARIPIAHLHGGEATEGLIDEAIRHAVTKMAQLHFVAAEPYRRRVIQLGEAPERVFDVGAPGLDNIRRLELAEREELETYLGISMGSPTFLVTYHPVTLSDQGPEHAMNELFKALDAFPEAHIIFTKPNADTGGRQIAAMIDAYVAERPGRTCAHTSLGQRRYLGAMRLADVVIGNSSSGLIEAPAMRRACVNIGDRQRGRLRSASVIDTREMAAEIQAAITLACSPAFQAAVRETTSPFGDGHASERIVKVLKTFELDGLVVKHFHDLEGGV